MRERISEGSCERENQESGSKERERERERERNREEGTTKRNMIRRATALSGVRLRYQYCCISAERKVREEIYTIIISPLYSFKIVILFERSDDEGAIFV